MSFASAWTLWVLLPAWVLWILLQLRGRGRATIRFPTLTHLRSASSVAPFLWLATTRLRWLAALLCILALARPQSGRSETKLRTEGIDIVLAIDTSGSMKALDLDADVSDVNRRRNRLQVVQAVVDDFIRRRGDDQIGMVVFGTQAFTQCPLTLDHGIVSAFLARLAIGMAGDATAIGDAIGTAVKRLNGSKAKSKVVILLTDGEQTAGVLAPIKAAEVAATFGIKVYTVGTGTRGKAPVVAQSLFGPVVQWEEVSIDEDVLRQVAQATGGQYYRATDTAGLEEVYTKIDLLERTELTSNAYMEYDERFGWFVIPAMMLLFVEQFLLGTRLRRLP
jgi:Ca-activated chloride channel family protein